MKHSPLINYPTLKRDEWIREHHSNRNTKVWAINLVDQFFYAVVGE